MVKREILPLALANSAKFTAVDAYADVVGMSGANLAPHEDDHGEGSSKAWGLEEGDAKRREREPGECIIDIREHDVNYYLRVAIDLGECESRHFPWVSSLQTALVL